ncbi:MAG: hypothetical protein RRY34_10690 [Victivallaceae bacterium]
MKCPDLIRPLPPGVVNASLLFITTEMLGAGNPCSSRGVRSNNFLTVDFCLDFPGMKPIQV